MGERGRYCLTDGELDFAMKQCAAGVKVPEIARMIDVDKDVIYKKLRVRGFEFDKRVFVGERLAALIADYNAGMTQAELAVKYNTSRTVICQYLNHKAEGVAELRGIENRKYTLNEHAFDRAEEREAAAWMVGFLLADGSVWRNPYSKGVNFALEVGDRDAVEAFARIVETDKPIATEVRKARGRFPACTVARLDVVSTHMHDVLVGYGVTMRKTGSERVDDRLFNNRHCWRGVFDGDGGIWRSQGRTWSGPNISFGSSSLVLMEQFVAYCEPIVGPKKISVYHPKNGKTYYTVLWVGRKAVALLHHLYDDAEWSLARKKRLAEEMYKWVPRRSW